MRVGLPDESNNGRVIGGERNDDHERRNPQRGARSEHELHHAAATCPRIRARSRLWAAHRRNQAHRHNVALATGQQRAATTSPVHRAFRHDRAPSTGQGYWDARRVRARPQEATRPHLASVQRFAAFPPKANGDAVRAALVLFLLPWNLKNFRTSR
jgi:hypothetical protein